MRVRKALNHIAFTLLFFSASTITLVAQPSAERLADDMVNKNAEWLSQIETMEMTMKMNEGDLIPDMTTRYVKKTNDNGTPYLEIESEEPMEMDYSAMAGSVDQMVELIRGAESITEESLADYNTYKVFVNDSELLKSLDQGEIEMEDMEFEFDRATFWIDSDKMYVRRVLMEQTVDGEEMKLEMNLENYETYSGYPVPMKMTMKIDGMSSQFSEEEIAEARRSMEEMEEQLSQMPESQRSAIEKQLKPQMEQFERMIEGGEGMTMTMNVTEVKVNE